MATIQKQRLDQVFCKTLMLHEFEIKFFDKISISVIFNLIVFTCNYFNFYRFLSFEESFKIILCKTTIVNTKYLYKNDNVVFSDMYFDTMTL